MVGLEKYKEGWISLRKSAGIPIPKPPKKPKDSSGKRDD